MRQTTAAQLAINELLPEDLRDYNRVLDAKGISGLLKSLAQNHPQKYREISHQLMQLGHREAELSGGFSFGPEHLHKSVKTREALDKLQRDIDAISDDESLSPDEHDRRVVELMDGRVDGLHKNIYDEALASRNPLALQIASGTRGKPGNLASLIGSDLSLVDHRGKTVPMPVTRSYSEGLTPAEYWASSYGTRAGLIDVKLATAKAGYYSKLLAQATHRLLVTADDDPDRDPSRGLPVDVDDSDNEGAVLSRDAGPLKAGTVLTPRALKQLKLHNIDKILVRSPLVGGPRQGGVYAQDVGMRELGGIPSVGTNVGMTAAAAAGEPAAQGSLNAKHRGGVAGQGASVTGFDRINSLISVPRAFPGGAAHAEKDGRVEQIIDNPGGGKLVRVDGVDHHVRHGQEPTVKPGDMIEAGDALSNGFPNPAVLVRHKGIGEGSRQFVELFRRAYREAGMPMNRRNAELIAKGLINHVRVNDVVGEYAPGDVVSYSALEHSWEPREDSRAMNVAQAKGKFLEKPTLHYSIGTRVTPAVQKQLAAYGVGEVHVHDESPPFEPTMIRAADNLQHDPDWMTRMYGSGLKGGLQDAVHRGAVSDSAGTSFVPSLAKAVNFGREGLVRTPTSPPPFHAPSKPPSLLSPQPSPLLARSNL